MVAYNNRYDILLLMRKKSRERNARNRLYQQNHIKIGKTILSLLPKQIGWLKIKSVMQKTKLSKQTINKHYSELGRAPILIQQNLLKEYNTEIEKQSAILTKYIPDTNRRLFYILMLFMSRNRQLFIPICNNNVNRDIIYKMVEKIYPDLEVVWMPQNAPRPELGDERVRRN